MLVLSRRPGESILIGRDIEIVVLAVDGLQVRVGINAPREITVLRRELQEQVQAENRRAVAGPGGGVLQRLRARAGGPSRVPGGDAKPAGGA
jgi:carbon storage regulator